MNKQLFTAWDITIKMNDIIASIPQFLTAITINENCICFSGNSQSKFYQKFN